MNTDQELHRRECDSSGVYPCDGRRVRTGQPSQAVKVDTSGRRSTAHLARAPHRATADACGELLWVCAGDNPPATVRIAAATLRQPRIIVVALTDLITRSKSAQISKPACRGAATRRR
ncbi:hypothetical protein NWFMUON74_07960 [Nocardia wallacei]|uniref:Uncharacterized protein n=1 Tax=Nocardia wallacei TaxID=480035 RepID=A0A7G1KHS5_9NOCA|nr:hypothetical protein NWFMUON74_07960 [Nocardia wallacei]